MRGTFITFEGGEGAGKSTQIVRLAERLKEAGKSVLVTREPGGSPGAEAVRHVLLSGAAEPFGTELEAILFAAARSDHVEQKIKPALRDGTIVLCDRFFDSSRVYQGVTGDVDPDLMTRLEEIAAEDCWPDLTLILDLDPEIGLERAIARRGDDTADRYEKEDLDLQQRRRQAFLDIAEREPLRCSVINADQDEDAVTKDIWAAVSSVLGLSESEPEEVRDLEAAEL